MLRVISSGAAWYSLKYMTQGHAVMPPGYRGPAVEGAARWIAGPWLRADGAWYLKIATQGYGESGTYAFFPIFPMLVRVVRPLFGGNELWAGLAVANASCLIGFWLLFKLFARWRGPGTARTCLLGLALFPTAFFLVAPYAEPVLLMTGAATLLLAANGRFGSAAVAGMIAGATRPFGMLLFIPAALLVPRRKGALIEPLTAGFGPLAGFGLWVCYVWFRTGDLLGAVRVQQIWQRKASFPPVTLFEGYEAWLQWRGTPVGGYMLIDLVSAVFVIALIVAAAVALRGATGRGARPALALTAYGVAVLVAATVSKFPPRPLQSLPRFALALFPLWIGYSALRRPLLVWAVLLASAAGLFVASAAFVASRPLY